MKWTKEKCKEEALKYRNRNDFKINSGAYRPSLKNNWLDEISKHMMKPYEKNIIWTKEKCKEEALKYNIRKDFKNKNGAAYNSAYNNNWLNEICNDMIQPYKKNNYWIKEKCQKEALKYNSRNDFKKGSPVAYSKSIKIKWMDEICLHMNSKYHSDNYYTKEKCKEEALKYKSRIDFCKGSNTYYKKSLKNNWMDEICNHMKKYGNRLYRCIYAYEFIDNHVYVGLTYNLENRNYKHHEQINSPVLKHIKKTSLIPKLIQLTDYIFIEKAIVLEGVYIENYKKIGWLCLNKNKSGGIGGNIIKWSKEKCKEEALKYTSRSNFAKNNPSAYSSSRKHGWLNDVCCHMITKI